MWKYKFCETKSQKQKTWEKPLNINYEKYQNSKEQEFIPVGCILPDR